jgi:glutamate-5-semialdehyde dehydrogenase
MIPASESDWADEYLRLAMAVRVVPDVKEAVSHINGTAPNTPSASCPFCGKRGVFPEDGGRRGGKRKRFHPFTDGFMFGFGAELGISTKNSTREGRWACADHKL